MKIIKIIKIISLVILLNITYSSFAKDYVVEMIFFSDTHSRSPVHISTDPINPNLTDAIVLNEDAGALGFFPYPEEAWQLSNEAHTLRTSGRYRVIEHIAWLQPGLPREEAIPVRIHAGINYQDEFQERTFSQSIFSEIDTPIDHPVNELDGTIKIVLGRYLHVYTDLAYRKPFSVSSSALDNPLGKERILADFAVKSHRKMRSKTLHYIDHPLLGILVEIRPVETENETEAEIES